MYTRITKPYYIFTPPYTHKSAGVQALHLLCHILNERSQKAYLVSTSEIGLANPYLNAPYITENDHIFFRERGIDPIIVYPDIVKGNPGMGKNVVRWLLGYPGTTGGDTMFPKTDLLVGYSTKIARSVNSEHVLCPPLADPHIFYNAHNERSGLCYYAHKHLHFYNGQILPDHESGINLEGNPEYIADILRKSAVCYVYENSSIVLEALVCSCPVVLMPSETFKELHTEEDWGKYGWRWHDEENIAVQKDEIKDYFRLHNLEADFFNQLTQFITITQEM